MVHSTKGSTTYLLVRSTVVVVSGDGMFVAVREIESKSAFSVDEFVGASRSDLGHIE